MSNRRHIAGRYRNETPFLRMMIPFICGIVIQIFHPFAFYFPGITLLVIVVLLMLHAFIKKLSGEWKIRWIAGFMLQLVFLLSGILITFINTEINDSSHFQYHLTPKQLYIARITKPLLEKPGSYKTIAEIFSIKDKTQWQKVRGQVLVYFKKDSSAAKLKYGDLFCFTSAPVTISAPLNPEEFNYKRFLYFHQVYQQVYLSGDSWIQLQGNHGNLVIAAAYGLRNIFIDILRKYLPGQREFAVASALVVGYEDEVDQELISAYSSAGALHVLSVSGMHVGLIYQGLFLILGFMNRKKWSRHFLHAFLICFIWFYAFLTGFSPSVARSAVMLTVVIIGRWFGGNTNVFNTLIVTAFALLIYNPYFLTEVGFQLSFLAVWGIIYFHPKIFLLFEPTSRIMHWVWEITSISLSAQLMTFPLGLLYFHQFPNLFMLSNLVVIPLSGIIIYACITVLLLSPVPVICAWIAKVTSILLWILNASVLVVEHVPGSVLSRIYISVFETWTIYLLLACTTAFLLSRKPLYLNTGLLLVIVLVTGQLYEKFENMHQRQIIIYDIPKQHAMDLVDGEKHVFVTDSVFAGNHAAMMFHVMHNWWNLGMKEDAVMYKEMLSEKAVNKDKGLWMNKHFIYFNDKKILLADKSFSMKEKLSVLPAIRKLKIDYLIISDNSIKDIKDVSDYFDCKKIIINSSNSKYKAEKWMDESHKLGINCYSVLQSGAFVEKF